MVPGMELRKISPPSEDRGDVTLRPGLRNRAVHIRPDAGEPGEVAPDVLLGAALRHPELTGGTGRPHPVEDAVVDHLGEPAAFRSRQCAEHVGRRPRMDVLATLKR